MTSKQALEWLAHDALPLWSSRGFNRDKGHFVEALSRQGEPLEVPCRSMVQARQVYSFVEAWRLQLLSHQQTLALVEPATRFLIDRYSLNSGGFAHAVDKDGVISNPNPDLYAQAFALFALAQTYELTNNSYYKDRAKKCVHYLKNERHLKGGGFTEIENGQIIHASNPHMHLFEAVLAWMHVDQDPLWHETCQELLDLALNKFIDPATGALAEKFDAQWTPLRTNGQFVFEPGHQYEWAWLLREFEKLTSISVGQTPQNLFNLAETCGIHPQTKLAIDELWSDHKPKKLSSRFWPQGERVKAAVVLGKKDIAEQTLSGLFGFLNSPSLGLWEDTLDENGQFSIQPIKASSLYHIINAISEYVKTR